ncbi:hypothetical protein [Pseudomonas fluorescens]|uniref:Uncharacterized protein n=1 Tax=Pseudomonas fluorescens TaxID=294 RepID=A0A0F4UT22_PSEFL|nr:hypothetical protein [Pseudomonas fluorescens]KJZ59514.1 hypothetical protein VD17_30220 [Pseudomonas fluorescens]
MSVNEISENYNEIAIDAEDIDVSAVALRTEAIVEAGLAKLNIIPSLEHFVGSMDGRWNLPTNTGWSLSVYNFSGSLINLSQGSWIATGRATAKSSASREFEMAWSIEYDSPNDTIEWTAWGQTQTFIKVSTAESPITWQYNHDSGKFVVLVRRTVPLGSVNIAKSSYLQSNGA